MNKLLNSSCLLSLLICISYVKENPAEFSLKNISQLYKAAPDGVQIRWANAENVNAEKGKDGMTNKGAKGDTYTL